MGLARIVEGPRVMKLDMAYVAMGCAKVGHMLDKQRWNMDKGSMGTAWLVSLSGCGWVMARHVPSKHRLDTDKGFIGLLIMIGGYPVDWIWRPWVQIG